MKSFPMAQSHTPTTSIPPYMYARDMLYHAFCRRDYFVYGLSQSGTPLHYNVVSYRQNP